MIDQCRLPLVLCSKDGTELRIHYGKRHESSRARSIRSRLHEARSDENVHHVLAVHRERLPEPMLVHPEAMHPSTTL
jgi:hypothetical protein